MKDILRVAAVSPRVHIGNVTRNLNEIEKYYKQYKEKVDVIATPELSITGYTCADLFCNRMLLENAKRGLIELVKKTKKEDAKNAPLLVVGLPLEVDGDLWNCAAAIQNGKILAVIPKTYLPNYGEFYEKRWFQAGKVDKKNIYLDKDFPEVIFGNNILISLNEPDAVIGIEICEDAWTPISPGRFMALNGAEVIINISASNEVIGKDQYRRNMIGDISASCLCGYIYTSAGMFESTSDLVFGGHRLVFENGKCIGESKPFEKEELVCDIMLSKIKHDRIMNRSFGDCRKDFSVREYYTVLCEREETKKDRILSEIPILPFVPSKDIRKRCMSIFNMQVAGLQRRLMATGSKHLVIGISGGLDSTLALLVAAKAVRNAERDPSSVLAVTMPGFGTTERTKNNSLELMKILGCDIREISIEDAVRQHFKDIGHDEKDRDITYENCQARERTQILMDIANKEGGFVVGTGDLSELALGWCTYNGDHMSMYAVNTSIPKTLIKTLVGEIGAELDQKADLNGLGKIIEDIIDTPVSPELLPPNEDGTISQMTEDSIGSYVLHDFFLYYTLRFGMSPQDILALCKEAVEQSNEYKFNENEIRKWMKVFYKRFFKQQFKRNCMPDGVKVGTVSVSPRGDLRFPSEIEGEEWFEGI